VKVVKKKGSQVELREILAIACPVSEVLGRVLRKRNPKLADFFCCIGRLCGIASLLLATNGK